MLKKRFHSELLIPRDFLSFTKKIKVVKINNNFENKFIEFTDNLLKYFWNCNARFKKKSKHKCEHIQVQALFSETKPLKIICQS